MTDLLKAEMLTLRPASLADKRKIFEWMTNSNLSSEMFGLPNFPNNPAPTWEEFDNDYTDNYFEGSKPLKGRCFIIEYNEIEIGQLNYNEIDLRTNSTELDIWLADRKFTGKGLGTEAIKMLCRYLHQSFGCKNIYVAPSRRNKKAIKAYEKAGFANSEILPPNFIPDYDDTVSMIKKL